MRCYPPWIFWYCLLCRIPIWQGRIISASGIGVRRILGRPGRGDASADCTIRIWDVSAVLDGIEFEVEVKEGPHESGGWFRQGIALDGWVNDEPICIRLPEVGVAVELLN